MKNNFMQGAPRLGCRSVNWDRLVLAAKTTQKVVFTKVGSGFKACRGDYVIATKGKRSAVGVDAADALARLQNGM